MSVKKPVVLIVLDGWGYREDSQNNAVAAARKPNFDQLWQNYPHALLKASGNAVGLPDGQMGNSEVGHMTIGAGRPIDADLVRIDKAIADGSFDQNSGFLALFDHVKKFNSTLHVQGLLSSGGVHSHQNHLYAFLRLAKKHGVPRVALHVFTDGRDTPPQSASEYLKELEDFLVDLGSNFFVATISGRYYAMDRDNNWDRLAKVEQALFECRGQICQVKPSIYLQSEYQAGRNDELLEPVLCVTPTGIGCVIKKNDGVFFFNFRADRARMISEKLLAVATERNILFVTLTEYSADFKCLPAFAPLALATTLGQELAQAGFKQARIAETEKFAHATYFLNGGRETPHQGEKDIVLASRKDIKTHDEAPEMRAAAIADKVIEEINQETDFIFVNFANPDMVGHTANVPAIITAIETVDTELGRVIEALKAKGGVALITADHGNAEINLDPATGAKHTAHTTNPVPVILTKPAVRVQAGGLADLAPTILTLLGLPIPKTMTGRNLLN